jgi:ribonuclease T2
MINVRLRRNPENCTGGSVKPFDPSELKGIMEQLEKYWPSFITDTPPLTLWKYEYDMHGTCAASLPALDTQLKYFNTALAWREQFDIIKVRYKIIGGIVQHN